MAQRTHTLKVKTSEYTDAQGQTKARWVDVGSVLKNDKGPFLMINKHFNPAGIETRPGSDAVMVSIFEVDDTPKPQPAGDDFGDQQIPF